MKSGALPASALLMLALLAGCAAPSRPVTIAEALATLQSQLRAAGAINASASTPAQFARSVRSAQCEADNADPEVPILSREITIDLTGSFTAGGGFAVGPAITGGPPFGLSGSLTRGQTQGLTLPLTFASLSALPDVVAAQRVALFSGLPASTRRAETRRALVSRDGLRRRIRVLIAGFDAGRCVTAAPAMIGVLHPMRRRRRR